MCKVKHYRDSKTRNGGTTRGLTIRLPRDGTDTKGIPFTAEQFADLESLIPDWSTTRLVAEALLHYSKVLPNELLAQREAELEEFRNKVKKVTG
jgi:hypothetical protein